MESIFEWALKIIIFFLAEKQMSTMPGNCQSPQFLSNKHQDSIQILQAFECIESIFFTSML